MKFETILNAYSKAVGNLDWRTQSHDDFIHGIRQCWAFRARLMKMYLEEYRPNHYRLTPDGKRIYDPLPYPVDPFSISKLCDDETGVRQMCRAVQDYANKKGLKEYRIGVQLEAEE